MGGGGWGSLYLTDLALSMLFITLRNCTCAVVQGIRRIFVFKKNDKMMHQIKSYINVHVSLKIELHKKAIEWEDKLYELEYNDTTGSCNH